MKKIIFNTSFKKIPADLYTPVGIYLRLRDRFRDTILLESSDSHAAENSLSIIGINAIGGIEITDHSSAEYKLPAQQPQKISITASSDVTTMLLGFLQRFQPEPAKNKQVTLAQGLFGYTSYDAVSFFETIRLKKQTTQPDIPLIRYRLYQYVIIIDHFKDELYICENHFEGVDSEMEIVESIIRSKDVPVFPFGIKGEETSNMTGDAYMAMVQKGIAACQRGDSFQVVLSRRFHQQFTGDEFNVYRALRSINPGPYLFYFDYGDYKLLGSSPESQLIIDNKIAMLHPIAGTVRRTGDDDTDVALAKELENDVKENAEHVMLVDLARNDLGKMATGVTVTEFKKVQYYSHVIHLVSKVKGFIAEESNPFKIMAGTFPAGTLSGAPKFKSMQLIDEIENVSRGFYGGMIGYIGFNGNCNHAIMIRTFLSQHNTLICQAGAGITVASKPAAELQEVNNKLIALKNAVDLAQSISN